MRLQATSSRGELKKAFSNLRLLTFLFIFFIFLISGTTVLVIATQTKANIISLTRDEIRTQAAIAALQIDGDALADLKPGDETLPSFRAIRERLDAIRLSNDKIRYIYTMRRSADGIEFVVDGDYGISGDAARIGQVYPDQYPELLAGFMAPSADIDFTTDEWGTVLSGYAPVRNNKGDIVGLIGIDMDENSVVERFSYLNGVFLLLGILSILAAVVGIIVIERRRSIDEEMIVANRNYLTQIFESVRAGILIVDAGSHIILDANPAALAMIGAQKEDVTGKICHRYVCPNEAGKCPITDLGQSMDNSERVVRTTGGQNIPVIKYVVPIVLDGNPCFLETFVDITDRKKAEEDLLGAIRKLKILTKVTRNDIITDIYALEGYLELIRDDLPVLQGHPLAGRITWVMERIRLKSVFFKDYDETGTKDPVWQDLTLAVSSAVERLRTTRLAVTSDVAGLSVYADPLLEKVFFQLLDNTLIHGMHATKVAIRSHAADNNTLVLIYEDNGTGIPEPDKERVFERGIGTVTGLGLFLAREILTITGITIRECGEPGRGVRFEIIVPEGKYRFVSGTDRPGPDP